MEPGVIDLEDLTQEEQGRLEQIYKQKEELVSRILQLETQMVQKQCEIDALALEEIDYHIALQDPKQQIRAFNKKPTFTMDKLVEGAIVEKDPKAVAAYLWNTNGLSKKAVGDYLGGDSELARQALREFIELQHLAGLDIVKALRAFFSSFHLSGESQVIDRVLETFSAWFCDANKDHVFADSGNCHTFLYAVLMLNTSLHNPKVVHSQDVMKLADFLKICEGTGLPKDFITNTYNEVKSHPFVHDKFSDIVRGLKTRCTKSGYLLKQSSKGWKWNRRWFALMDHCLFYFEDELIQNTTPRGIISLEAIRFRQTEDRNHPYCLELFSVASDSVTVCKLEAMGTVPKTSHGTVKLAAESEKDLQAWIAAMEQSSWIHEYYGLIQTKRTRSTSQT